MGVVINYIIILFLSLSPANGKPAHCQLPPVSGLCEAYMPSFFYNATSKQCEKFVYGGCGGNKNRFQTKESCLESCGKQGKS